MKKKSIIMMMLAIACIMFVSCKQKEEPVTYVEPVAEEVYEPVHTWYTVEYPSTTYNYYCAPKDVAAECVEVIYDQADIYITPIEVVYTYENGDSYTYVLEDFGIWKNSADMYRLIVDDDCTVWIQGQNKAGRFYEFVFYGDPQYDDLKITPNSYRNLPAGEIKYRK